MKWSKLKKLIEDKISEGVDPEIEMSCDGDSSFPYSIDDVWLYQYRKASIDQKLLASLDEEAKFTTGLAHVIYIDLEYN